MSNNRLSLSFIMSNFVPSAAPPAEEREHSPRANPNPLPVAAGAEGAAPAASRASSTGARARQATLVMQGRQVNPKNMLNALKKLGLNEQQIARLKTPESRKAVCAHAGGLRKYLGCDNDQMIRMANNGGEQALLVLSTHAKTLKNNGFTNDQIIKMAGEQGASGTLSTLVECWDQLTARGLTPSDITALAKHQGSKKNLIAVAQQPWPELISKEQMLTMAARRAGSENLDWFLRYRAAFQSKGLSIDDIVVKAAGIPRSREEALMDADIDSLSYPKRLAQTSTEAPQTKRQKGNKGKESMVKREALPRGDFPSSGIVEGLDSIRLNTAQELHVPTSSRYVIEIGDDGADKVVLDVIARHMDEAIISSGKQSYQRELEKRFPIRDPAHPEQVHPLYADPHDPTRVAPHVNIKDVAFYKGNTFEINENSVWKLAQKEGTPYTDKTLYLEALKHSIMQEMRAMMEGSEPPSLRSITVQQIEHPEQSDGGTEFEATKGQYGAFLTNYDEKKQPSLRNAQLACVFAGARLETEEDYQAYDELLSDKFAGQMLHDYAASSNKFGQKKEVTWAPYAGGNVGQYINTTFKPSADDPNTLACDGDATNATFGALHFTLTDKDGKDRKETMMGVFITKSVAEGKQIKLDYGPKYTLELRQETEEGKIDPTIKMESEDTAMI